MRFEISSWLNRVPRPFRQSLLIGAIAAFGVGLITLGMKNTYASESRILPTEGRSPMGISQLASAAATFGVSIPGQEGGDGNFLDILGSRWMAESLLRTTFRYHERSWAFGREVERAGTFQSYLGSENPDLAVGKVTKVLTAKKDPKTKLLVIRAETTSADLSQALVKETTRLLEKFLLEKNTTRGGLKVSFTEARLTEAQADLAKDETTLLNFLSKNRNYQTSADPAVRLTGTRLESDFKVKQQLLLTLRMNREQALLEEKNDLPILNVLDSANLPVLKSGPSRSSIVFWCFLLSAGAFLVWRQRDWIKIVMSDR